MQGVCNFFLLENKECALAHSRACGGRLRHLPYPPQCASSRSGFYFTGKQFPVKQKKTANLMVYSLTHIYLQNRIQETLHLLTYLRLGYALDRLVSVSYMCYHTSTSDLSTSSSSRGLTTFVGISHLEGGFTLRCLQRLSLPGLATLLCSW